MTTILTRVTLNPGDRSVQHVLASQEALHAVVAAATDGSSRPLWRLEQDRLYIVSNTIHKDRLNARLGRPVIESRNDYDKFLNGIQQGQTRGFTITVNPSRISHGKRYPLKDADSQMAWLGDKLDTAGASTESVVISNDEVKIFQRKGKDVTVHATTFTGTLRVQDPDRLREAILSGIGKAKAYGCGLLLLAA